MQTSDPYPFAVSSIREWSFFYHEDYAILIKLYFTQHFDNMSFVDRQIISYHMQLSENYRYTQKTYFTVILIQDLL